MFEFLELVAVCLGWTAGITMLILMAAALAGVNIIRLIKEYIKKI